MNILYVNYVESREGLGTLDVFVPLRELARRGNRIMLVSINDGIKRYTLKSQEGDGKLEVCPMIPVAFRPLKSPMLLVVLTYVFSPLLLVKINQMIDRNLSQMLLCSSDYSLPAISFLLSKLRKLPLVLIHRETHLESFYFFSDHNFFIKHISLFLAKINQFFYNQVKHSIAISESIEVFLRGSLHLNNIKTINLLCVDLKEFSLVQRSVASKILPCPEELVVLYSGSLSKLRRVDILVEAFFKIARKYPNLRLVITGNLLPSQRFSLLKNVDDDLIGRLSFTGFLSRGDLLNLMHISSICVDTSPAKSWNPSGKIVEYMASEKCIITTDTFTHRFFIKNGVNGLLFEPNNVEDLASKLDFSLANPELRKKFGVEARRTIERDFDVRKVGLIMDGFLKTMISHKSLT